jgi:D-glycero-alpha-D-manno-heptose-7-phosphate kinase
MIWPVIITRSPLRISLGGGGTDLASYARTHGGFVLAGAIDKYVYIHIHRRFAEGFLLKYSQMEEVQQINDIRHPIIRECLRLSGIPDRNLEITSMADIPSGTGLGSSGSFTTALLKGLHAYRKRVVDPQQLAEQACHVEIDILGEPIGKQDQYIAAFGGLTCFEFKKDGSVAVTPLAIPEETRFDLEEHLVLFFTGYSRSASAILQDQDAKSRQADPYVTQNLHTIKELGLRSRDALEAGNPSEFGRLMDVHWQHKKQRSPAMTNGSIDRWYECALANGALGGKLIGAGGGGFLMFYALDKLRVREALREQGLREVRFRFDFEGTRILSQD